MVSVYIGIGSNLGDRRKNIIEGIRYLARRWGLEKISRLYESSPVEVESQPYFFNCCVKMRVDVSPFDLLSELKSIEKKIGRGCSKRFGPRKIDLDILFYGKRIINLKELTIPHPRLHRRKFVLMPLKDLSPNLKHPVLKKTISALLSELKDEGQKVYERGNLGSLEV